jgi:hypothetical protein
MTSAVDPRLRESFCPAELEDPNKAWTITAEGQPPPTEAGGYPTDQERRAGLALQEHIAMTVRMSYQWKKIPASQHEHIQLLSEPDD